MASWRRRPHSRCALLDRGVLRVDYGWAGAPLRARTAIALIRATSECHYMTGSLPQTWGEPGTYAQVLRFCDLVAALASLRLAEEVRRVVPVGQQLGPGWGGIDMGIYILAGAVWVLAFRSCHCYDPDHILNLEHETRSVLVALGTSALLLAGLLFVSYRVLSRLLFGYFVVLDVLLTLVVRLVVRAGFEHRSSARARTQRVLLVGAGNVGQRMADLLLQRAWMGVDLIGFVDDDPGKQNAHIADAPVLGTSDDLVPLVERLAVTDVVITLPTYAHDRLRQLVSSLTPLPVNVRIVPDYFAIAYLRARAGTLGDMPLITLKEPALDRASLLAKRVIDIALALLALVLGWPLMLSAAIWIRLDSKGPVLFKQVRVGWHGEPFTMLKFRTMVPGAESSQGAITVVSQSGKRYLAKSEQDPRITRAGRVLRRWSMDELPQLFNVLKGEMSMVGPRPELPVIAQSFEPWERKRLCVPPGITGYWQVTGRSTKPSALHVEDDLYYIINYSLLFDLWILSRTVGAVIRGEGAF